jgi:hypothetical protein
MFRCNLVRPNGDIQELDTRVLGDTTLAMTSAMIANEVGNRTHPDEIYIFGVQRRRTSADRAYYLSSQNTTDKISKERLANYLLNIVNFKLPKDLFSRRQITYNDLINLNLSGEQDVRIPLSIAVNAETQYPISANPFDWVAEDTTISDSLESIVSSRNNAVIFDSDTSEPILFCCLAADVLGSFESKEDASIVSRLYFPLLAARGIQSASALRAAKMDEATPPPPPTQQALLKLIEYSRSETSIHFGVSEIIATIHPELPVHLPLELLFRSQPCSAEIPFVKFNMGKRGSRLYRVYAPVNDAGIKEPSFTAKQLSRLQTAVAMQEGIGYATFGHETLATLEVMPNANLRVRLISQHTVPLDEIEQKVNSMLGGIITKLNFILNDTGFQFAPMIYLTDSQTDVQHVTLRGRMANIVRFVPAKIANCLTSAMFTTSIDDSLAEFVYHRVGYYERHTAIERFIVERLRKGRGVRAIISGLERGFGMDQAQANQAVAAWAGKAQDELNAHANKRLKLATSGGVDIKLERDRKTRSMTILASGSISLTQAKLLGDYLKTTLIASSAPVAGDRLLSEMGGCVAIQDKIGAAGIARTSPSAENELEKPAEAKPITVAESKLIVADDDDDDDEEDDLLDLYGDMGDDDDINEGELSELLLSEDASTPTKQQKSVASPTDLIPASAPEESPSAAAAPAPSPAAPTTPQPLAEKRDADVAGMKLSDPNYFLHRLYERDPKLFLSKQQGRFDTYSRLCPHNLRRQPVVLTQAEKERMEREAPGSFDPSSKGLISYSSGDGPKNWYMCPRYWCLKTDLPMTQEQVDAGECGGKVIPYKAKVVPDDAFIFAFDSEGRNQEHVKKDGTYAQHYPGFLSGDRHPDGLCIPCCFKNVDQAKVRKRIEMCTQQEEDKDASVKAAEAAAPKKATRQYVKDPNKFPLANGDVGFLAPSIQQLLNTDNTKCFVSEKDKTIRKGKACILRGGVGKNKERSLLFAVATTANLSVDQLVRRLTEVITPATITNYQQGTLIDSLVPREYLKQAQDEARTDLTPDSIKELAAERLRDMLANSKQEVGYQYLWDIVRFHAFDEIVNLLVLLIDDDDGTSNPKLICPDAIKSNRQYVSSRPTLLLLLKGGYYEPVMVFKASADANQAPLVPVERLIGLKGSKETDVKNAVDRLGEIANGCGGDTIVADGLPSYRTVANAIMRAKGEVRSLIVNYDGRLIGLLTSIPNKYEKLVVPVESGQTINTKEENGVMLIGSAPSLASLTDTISAIDEYRKATGLRLRAESIIVEDGMVVAVHLLSDRVIPITPTKEYTINEKGKYKGLDIVSVPSGDGPSEAARVSVLGQGVDEARVQAADKIKAYNDTYDLFRSWVRGFLLQAQQVPLRKEISKIMKQNASVGTKLRLMQSALATALRPQVVMVELVNLPPGITGVREGKFYIPSELFTFDDVMLRLADEILRFPSASKFILGRTMFYSTQTADYVLNKDELVLPESLLVPTELNARGLDELIVGNVGPSAAISQNADAATETFAESVEAIEPSEASIPNRSPRASASEPAPADAAPAPASAPAQPVSDKCTITRKSLHPTDKLIKRKLMIRGSQLLIPLADPECIWKLLTLAVGKVLNTQLTVADVISALSLAYRALSDGDSKRAVLTWRAERKATGLKRGEVATGPVLGQIVEKSDYAASNIDLFFLAKTFGVTFVIISSKVTGQTGTEVITYSGLDDANLLKRVIVCKRGQKGLLAFYNLIVSEKEMRLNNILPAFAELIKENLLPQPYHMPPAKVVSRSQ